jgi:dephospho-CoA kinase
VNLVIGLTGSNAAGKGEAAAHLARRGFAVHSLSDVVRDEARARGLPPEREHLIRIGTQLRREGGPGVLARRLLPRLVGCAVADSIRNPAEVEVLREGLERFVLVGLTASPEARFGRMVARGRPGDPRTVEEFEGRERQENASDPNGQQLTATFEMADRVVDNSGSLDDLARELDRVLGDLGFPLGGLSA